VVEELRKRSLTSSPLNFLQELAVLILILILDRADADEAQFPRNEIAETE
jgi:hypothetical protein